MRTHISFSVVAITLSLVVACVDHRPGSVGVVKDQSWINLEGQISYQALNAIDLQMT